jgi:hypothetical protein
VGSLPSVDPRAADIMQTLAEFDASVEIAEAALVERDWNRLDGLLSDQHRLTHALSNALEATRDVRPQAFSDEVQRRVQSISARREDQMRRLMAFNHLVKERLKVISRVKEMRSVNVLSQPPARILNILQ